MLKKLLVGAAVTTVVKNAPWVVLGALGVLENAALKDKPKYGDSNPCGYHRKEGTR